jgi:hypothetical protein
MFTKRWLATLAALALLTPNYALASAGDGPDNKPPDATKTDAATPVTKTAASPAAASETKASDSKDSNSTIQSELELLKSEVEAQRAALAAQQQHIAELEAAMHAGGASPSTGGSSAAPAVEGSPKASSTIASTPPAFSATPASGAVAVNSQPPSPQTGGTAISGDKNKSPLSFKIGSADFTPGGWADITGIFRSTDIGSGTGTTFQSIPYNNTLPNAALSEFRFTAQTSRISMKVDAPINDSTKVTAYIESDFNGLQPPNAYISTNSGTFRLRLFWADIRHNKWEMMAGQSWSMLTPNRVGLSPLPADIFTTARLDTNYIAGLTYARQAGFRVVYHPTDWWSLGFALENPQQYVPSSVVFPGASGYFAGQFDNGSGATNGTAAASNTAIPNLHPDVIVKSTEDWKIDDHALHVEEAGLIRSFKVFNNLVMPSATDTITGGGAALNANLELFPRFHLIFDSFWSDGGARYIGGLGPDVIVKANGQLSAVHSGSGIAGFEYQVTPSFLFDAYYSGAYFSRNFDLLASTAAPAPSCEGVSGFTCVGYGFQGSANSNNRAIQEGTFGFTKTFWSNPNFGKLQFISQSSYATRAPWSVASGAPVNAHAFIQYVDLRYVLP